MTDFRSGVDVETDDDYLNEAINDLMENGGDYLLEDEVEDEMAGTDFEKRDDGTFFAGRGKRQSGSDVSSSVS